MNTLNFTVISGCLIGSVVFNQPLAKVHKPHLMAALSKNTCCWIKPWSMNSGPREVHWLDFIGIYQYAYYYQNFSNVLSAKAISAD